MARCFFDIRGGTNLLRDDEGTEFGSVDTAVQGAARSAAEIGTGRLAKRDFSDVIEVRNEHDRKVGTVTASMRIDRRDQTPHAPHRS